MALLPPLVGGAAWGGKTTLDLHKGCLDCLHDLMHAQARYLVITPRGLGLRLPARPDACPGAALLLREGRSILPGYHPYTRHRYLVITPTGAALLL